MDSLDEKHCTFMECRSEPEPILCCTDSILCSLSYTAGNVVMPRTEAYGSSFVCLSVIMPRAELSRYTVIVLSVILSVCCKYFSSLTEN